MSFMLLCHVIVSVFTYTLPLCKKNLEARHGQTNWFCWGDVFIWATAYARKWWKWINSIKAVAYDIGIGLKLPRICARQVRRNKVPLSCNLNDFDLFVQIQNHFRVNSYFH